MTLFIYQFDSQAQDSYQPTADAMNGMRLAVKDNIDVQGTVSSLGSAAFNNAPQAKQNADVVQALLDANYSLLGKLNMHELAFGMTGVNHTFGTPENPLFPEMITGGSSSACAAAVAAGVVDVAIGTDTGGSVRLPAACCAVVGLKPSFDRISREGVQPRESELDCVGVFARSVTEVESAMQAMDASFKPKAPSGKVTLGVVIPAMAPEVEQAFSACIETLKNDASISLVTSELSLLSDAFEAGLSVISQEVVDAFGELPQEQLGADVAKRIENARSISSLQLNKAQEIKKEFIAELNQQFASVDAIVLPTLPSLPMSRDDAFAGKVDLSASCFVRPFNLTGNPAISLPIAANQAPIGLQIVGQHGDDEMVCAVARHIETLIELPNYELKSNRG